MNILKGFAVLALVIGLGGCVVEGPVPPGPRVHFYDYYYYPSVGVYFDIGTGYYYYRSGGGWVHTLTLPPTIRLDQRDRHRFESRDRDPYRNDQKNRERFKPIPRFQPNPNNDRKERDFHRKSHEQYRDKREPDKKQKKNEDQRRDRR